MKPSASEGLETVKKKSHTLGIRNEEDGVDTNVSLRSLRLFLGNDVKIYVKYVEFTMI